MDDKVLIPIIRDKYIPDITKRLFEKIIKSKSKKIALIGFSEHFRWLNRLLTEIKIKPLLLDWRNEFKSYDCGGKYIKHFNQLKKNEISKDFLFVICVDDIASVKDCAKYLLKSKYICANCCSIKTSKPGWLPRPRLKNNATTGYPLTPKPYGSTPVWQRPGCVTDDAVPRPLDSPVTPI